MRSEDIRKLLFARPFRPFRLRTSNILVYEIRHPEMAAVSHSILSIAVPPNQSLAGEGEVVLALLHIVQYEI